MDVSRVPSLTPLQVACLRKAGVVHAAELLTLGEATLMHVLGLSFAAARELSERVGDHLSPLNGTALDALQRARASAARVSTPLTGLNRLLPNRALPPVITELCGPAGVGKTQWCLTLTAIAAAGDRDGEGGQFGDDDGGGGGVIYIDTEDTFDAARLREVLLARYPTRYSLDGAVDGGARAAALSAALARVTVYRESSSSGLVARLGALEDVILTTGVRLVVVDSVAALARREWDAGEAVEIRARSELLARQASALKALAETFCLPVVVTNQITSRMRGREGGGGPAPFFRDQQQQQPRRPGGDGDDDVDAVPTGEGDIDNELVPALGNTWAHCVSNRFFLEAGAAGRGGGSGTLTILKSPCAPNDTLRYAISAGGVGAAPAVAAVAATSATSFY